MRKIITAGLQGPNHGKLKEIPPRVLQLKRSVATPVGRDGRGGAARTHHVITGKTSSRRRMLHLTSTVQKKKDHDSWLAQK